MWPSAQWRSVAHRCRCLLTIQTTETAVSTESINGSEEYESSSALLTVGSAVSSRGSAGSPWGGSSWRRSRCARLSGGAGSWLACCRTGRTRQAGVCELHSALRLDVCCRLRGEGARCPESCNRLPRRAELQAVPIAASPRASSQGAAAGAHGRRGTGTWRRVPEDERRSTRAPCGPSNGTLRAETGGGSTRTAEAICALLNRLARSRRPGRGAPISLGTTERHMAELVSA